MLLIALNAFPTLDKENAINNEKIITINPVPTAKDEANVKTCFDWSINGIKTPKNKTPLYGQNAKANNTPNKKDPRYPFFTNQFFNLPISFSQILKLILMIFNINKPIKINTGPSILSPHPWKIFEILKEEIPKYIKTAKSV